MSFINKNITSLQFQGLLLMVVFIIGFLSNLQYDPPTKSFFFAVLAMVFCVVIIWGNAMVLIPKFYRTERVGMYIISVLLLLPLTVYLRTLAGVFIFNTFSSPKKEQLTIGQLAYSFFSGIWIFIFSILYRLAIDYFALSKKQNELKAENAQTELHLLKQQLHPHFLFNTLNNIYYIAHEKSPEAAELIERLSEIMRYFIEESKKERVLLKDEVALLKSYIELENIRMRYEIPVRFQLTGSIEQLLIPPLLLLPLVENIFKHGIDKRSNDNFAEITLNIENNMLLFTTLNLYLTKIESTSGAKTGLINLEKRLTLYYQSNFKLIAEKKSDLFMASVQFPVYEN